MSLTAQLYARPALIAATARDREHRPETIALDFGPRGSVECVTPFGVLQFVMTSTAPWQEFPSLRARLAKQGRRLPMLGSDDQTANREYVRRFLLDDHRGYGKAYNLQWAERFYYVDDRPPARSKVDEYVEKNAVRL